MQYRKLGNTGYDVSVLGFGTWQIGGERWRRIEESEAVRLLLDAHYRGINIYDAAVVYGQYRDDRGTLQSRSLELLGEAFSAKRAEVIYCIKIGQFDEYSHRADYTPHRLIEQLRFALKQLRTDYLDICLIHAPSLFEVESENALSVLLTLQALGMVRAVGYSFENQPEHVAAALRQPVDVVMLQYNLLDRECETVLSDAKRRGVGVLVGGPLKRGYLSGSWRNIGELPEEDDYWRLNCRRNPAKVREILARVEEELDRAGSPKNLRREALRFAVENPGVSSAMVGHRALSEIQENIESMQERKLHLRRNIGPKMVVERNAR